MELRKDPITRSWVILGHPENPPSTPDGCPFCPGQEAGRPTLLALPPEGPWQVRVTPHLDPLYRIEGEPGRQADGMYDKMRPVGAHEVIVETRDHTLQLPQMSDVQIELVLQAYASRIQDLKRDPRFKYVTVFKNHGALSGEEWPHSHSLITATTFVPRRILYELRAAKEWHAEKERCVFCDIVRQEERQGRRIVDTQGDYVALCPYASRVPFEVWIIPRKHNYLFEQPHPSANRRNFAILLGRTLRRIGKISEAYHLAVHTSPNTSLKGGEFRGFWKTIADDYHWHIEILPIVEKRSKSYSIKEVYFNALMPEEAAEKLRQTDPSV
jgi:UDPglucose--hexose-1-phosphate uridylyltransferase